MTTDTDPYDTYYVAALNAAEGSGIQHCAYFDANWQRIWPQATLVSKTAVRIEQALPDDPNLPDDLSSAIDRNATLGGGIFRFLDDASPVPRWLESSDPKRKGKGRFVQVPVAGTTLGAILMFSVPGSTASLRATTDPQIKIGSPG